MKKIKELFGIKTIIFLIVLLLLVFTPTKFWYKSHITPTVVYWGQILLLVIFGAIIYAKLIKGAKAYAKTKSHRIEEEKKFVKTFSIVSFFGIFGIILGLWFLLDKPIITGITSSATPGSSTADSSFVKNDSTVTDNSGTTEGNTPAAMDTLDQTLQSKNAELAEKTKYEADLKAKLEYLQNSKGKKLQISVINAALKSKDSTNAILEKSIIALENQQYCCVVVQAPPPAPRAGRNRPRITKPCNKKTGDKQIAFRGTTREQQRAMKSGKGGY